MKLNRSLATNGVLAALYVVATALIQPFGFTHIQFRVPEMFNHLIVFNKHYFWGIILGVFLSNLFFSPMAVYDISFGVAHSALSLLITIGFGKFIKNIWILMGINTLVFSFNMFIISFMVKNLLQVDLSFLFIWLTTSISEFVIMAIGIPVMYAIHKRLRFDQFMTRA